MALLLGRPSPRTPAEPPAAPLTHPDRDSREPSILDGKYYNVYNHTLKGSDKDGRHTSISLLELIDHMVDATVACDNSVDRPNIPCWTTIDQTDHLAQQDCPVDGKW